LRLMSLSSRHSSFWTAGFTTALRDRKSVLIGLFLGRVLATAVWRRLTGGTAFRSWPLLVPVAVLMLEFLWEVGPVGVLPHFTERHHRVAAAPSGTPHERAIRVDLLLILRLVYGAIVGGLLGNEETDEETDIHLLTGR
jgi:hypothetical protein